MDGEDLTTILQAKHPKVFDGVGKLKDNKLKLQVDPEVTPIAQKPRRVPFALREKVTAKVEELIAMDIVERVDGPTSWVSPVVVVPKASGDIRLCVDMRKANQAIIRERIPILTVDEVLENLNGGRVFSKLDLRLGFPADAEKVGKVIEYLDACRHLFERGILSHQKITND